MLYEQSLNIIVVLTEILHTFVLFWFMLILNTIKKASNSSGEEFLLITSSFGKKILKILSLFEQCFT